MSEASLEMHEAARVVRATWTIEPSVAIVAGSGLGGLADAVEAPVVFAYDDLPGIPRRPGVVGHAGRLVCGTLADVPVCVFSGRVHMYQGASARDAAFPARLGASLGVKSMIVTNASGGLNERYRPGDLVLISDHINFMGDNPLVGWTGPEGGYPFIPMRDAYDPELRRLAIEASTDVGVPVVTEGVYCGLLGPSYETPAEVSMLRTFGADVVGMSSVPEVIAARALGLAVLGISLVANSAAHVGLSHAEVLDIADRAAAQMERLVGAVVRRIGDAHGGSGGVAG